MVAEHLCCTTVIGFICLLFILLFSICSLQLNRMDEVQEVWDAGVCENFIFRCLSVIYLITCPSLIVFFYYFLLCIDCRVDFVVFLHGRGWILLSKLMCSNVSYNTKYCSTPAFDSSCDSNWNFSSLYLVLPITLHWWGSRSLKRRYLQIFLWLLFVNYMKNWRHMLMLFSKRETFNEHF